MVKAGKALVYPGELGKLSSLSRGSAFPDGRLGTAASIMKTGRETVRAIQPFLFQVSGTATAR